MDLPKRQTVSSAADEVDNLKFISWVDGGGGPVVAANDGSVVFDGDAVTLDLEGGEEVGDGGGWGERGKLTVAAVDDDLHILNVSRGFGRQVAGDRACRLRPANDAP